MIIHIAIQVEPNPGPGIRAMIVIDEEGAVIYSRAQLLNHRAYTNFEFAYQTLIAAIKWAGKHTSGPVEIRTDQEILVKQLNGQWECRSERLMPLRDEALRLLEQSDYQIRYIPARENMRARLLCRMLAHETRKGGRVDAA